MRARAVIAAVVAACAVWLGVAASRTRLESPPPAGWWVDRDGAFLAEIGRGPEG